MCTDSLDDCSDLSPGLLRHATDCAFKKSRLGDDIIGRPRANVRDRHQRRIKGVNLTGHSCLDRRDHGCHRRHGVGAEMRHRRMTTASPHRNRQIVKRGHQRPRAACRPAHRQIRGDVQGKSAIHSIQNALVHHDTGPPEQLFARLEHEPHATPDLGSAIRQQTCRTYQHRRMRIVSTRMRPTVYLRAIGLVALLLHREGIGVGSEKNRRPIRGPRKVSHHRGETMALADLERESIQGIQNGLLRARILQTQLGVLVDLASQSDHFVHDFGG